MNANDILMGTGAPAAKFDQIGTTVTGKIVREPQASQQTDIRTKVPLTWKDGSPKMQVIVQLQTDQRDPQQTNDDGVRTIYIKGKNLTDAIRQAVRQSGANGLAAGGTLTVTYVADGQPEPGLNPPKLYIAQYQPPTVSLDGISAPAAPVAQQQMAPVQQAAAPAAPAVALQAPPGVDPAMWSRLSPDQQRAVIAASAQPAY